MLRCQSTYWLRFGANAVSERKASDMPRKPKLSEIDRLRKSALLMHYAGKIKSRVDVLLPRRRWASILRELSETVQAYDALTGKKYGCELTLSKTDPIVYRFGHIEAWIWCERD